MSSKSCNGENTLSNILTPFNITTASTGAFQVNDNSNNIVFNVNSATGSVYCENLTVGNSITSSTGSVSVNNLSVANALTLPYSTTSNPAIQFVTTGAAFFFQLSGPAFAMKMDNVIPYGFNKTVLNLPRISAATGTTDACSYAFKDGNSGIYQDTTNQFCFSASGTQVATISKSAQTNYVPSLNPTGTALVPSYSFQSNPNTGIYNSATNELSISASGTQVGVFSPTGNFSPVQPYFYISQSATLTIPDNPNPGMALTGTYWNSPVTNTIRGGFSFATGILTIPRNGIYNLWGQFSLPSGGSSAEKVFWFFRNGDIGDRIGCADIATNATTICNPTSTLLLNANDQIYTATYQHSGGSLNIGGTGYKLSQWSCTQLF